MREIACVALDITTVCDRACPDCCCGINMGIRPARHHPWEYFVNAARFLYGIDRIDVFGGEPTTHPRFAEFIPKFRELFGCRILSMTTDGFKVIQYAETLKHFDFIQASWYDARQDRAMVFLKANFDTRIYADHPVFTPRSYVGGGFPCVRAYGVTVSYADGKIWPCTPGPGLPRAIGIEPTLDWKERILEVPMPCATCMFSESAPITLAASDK